MSNDLIKITTNEEGKQLVSARELHEKLILEEGKKERFSQWFDRHLQYGFEENKDFTSVKIFTVVNNGAKRELQDYAVTIDMAKELCMLQKSDKGREFRRYFIECEKQLKEVSKQTKPALSREQELVLTIYNGGVESVQAAKELTDMKVAEAVKPLEEKIEIIQEDNENKTNVIETFTNRDNCISVGAFAKILNIKGMGRNKMFTWLRDSGILRHNNEPYQKYMDYFSVVIGTSDNEHTYMQTMITSKGVEYLYRKLSEEFAIGKSLADVKDEVAREERRNNAKSGSSRRRRNKKVIDLY